MAKEMVMDQIDKEIQKLKEEQLRIKEQMSELEERAKARLIELNALEEKKRWEEEKGKLESEFREAFTSLLQLNWQTIPKFLNESFAHIRGTASEYDRLKENEANLFAKFESLKKKIAGTDIDTAKIQSEIQRSFGEPSELIVDLKRLIRLIEENRSGWTQDASCVLRFIDVKREIPQMKW